MIYSLNEIDAHCKKAARGGGFEWGYAEEIGKVARWLAAYDLPGVCTIANYLAQRNSAAQRFSKPIMTDGTKFQATENSALCPVKVGAYLSDIRPINTTNDVEFQDLAYPLLLLPYLAQLANESNKAVIYRYEQAEYQFGNGILNFTSVDTLISAHTSIAYCSFDSESIIGKPAAVVGQDVNETDWKRLNKFAEKTYVPASQASRQGAGPAD